MARTLVRVTLLTFLIGAAGFVAVGSRRGWFDPRAPSERSFVKTVEGVDRIRVRTGGTCHRHIESERTLFEERKPSEIQRIVQSIRIDTANSGFHCMCCGGPSFEFYRGGELLVTLGYHHGKSLRWIEGWDGDGLLTQDSAATVNDWLASHGLDVDED